MALLAVPLALGLSGCGTFSVDDNMRALDRADAGDGAFTDELTEQYREFASFEYDRMYDWRDADYFARKGLRTAQGDMVAPEDPDDWSLPLRQQAVLRDARSRLVAMLDDGGRLLAPDRAALAQAKYDCWVEQQEENHQPDHIAQCRDAFWAALDDAEQLVRADDPASEGERVFFAFDSAKLTQEAMSALDNVVTRVGSKSVSSIVIEGHADRAGPSAYNVALSKQRLNAVRDYLIASGVSFVEIVERPYGESAPIVQTADGVPAPANRRAVVLLEP